ncbi:hypothetical protein AHAS_Ahas02G0169200 [Arachis hypogaea]
MATMKEKAHYNLSISTSWFGVVWCCFFCLVFLVLVLVGVGGGVGGGCGCGGNVGGSGGDGVRKVKRRMMTMRKTHYCRCQTKAMAIVYREMSQEKKDIMEEMEFGALENFREMNVSNTLLKELLDRFDEEKGCLKTFQGRIYITPWKVVSALGITNGGNIGVRKIKLTVLV